MARAMKSGTLLSACLTIAASMAYFFWQIRAFRTLAIVFGVTFYHLAIRLLIGYCYHTTFHNHISYQRKWFEPRKWEAKLYEALKVKKWKKHMPTYLPETFDVKKHSYPEILMAMCQAEWIHETIILFSFVPILLTFFFDSFWVFFITSLVSACVDALFVVMQRYNRQRILHFISKTNSKNTRSAL